MIPPTAHTTLKRMAKGFPVIAITGPRQSGKTTLARWAVGSVLRPIFTSEGVIIYPLEQRALRRRSG